MEKAMANNYLDELYELRQMLKFYLRKDFLEELVELADMIDHGFVINYHDIKERSKYGENCGFAAKAKDLFLKLKEKDISEKIEYIYKTFIEER